MFDRFSEDARKVLSASRKAAQDFRHDYIGTEHMLLGLVACEGTVAATALQRLGVDAHHVRGELTDIVRCGAHQVLGQLPFTPRAKRVLELALGEAQEDGHDHIGTGHLLLGVLREGHGIAAQVLGKLGLTLDKARPVVMDVMRAFRDARDGPPTPGPMIGETLRNILKKAHDEASHLKRATVEPEDALVAMVDGHGIAARVLRELGATPDGVRKRIHELRGT
jgi:ATP-dependent Clp protease ATP-binding subunit ClpC